MKKILQIKSNEYFLLWFQLHTTVDHKQKEQNMLKKNIQTFELS